jgi:cytochrome c oxidase accessory protein FixG
MSSSRNVIQPGPQAQAASHQAARPEAVVVSLYKAEEKVYPRSVSGFFNNWRWAMIWLTQLFFYGMPWLQWNGRQALLFDLEARRFYIFDLVLYPQDLIYLTAILIISAMSLFLFTAVAGRLWCGFTCPQTVYTEIFVWIESRVEGDRAARMRLDSGPWTREKWLRKGSKHFLWISLSLWTGFTFVGFFTPIRELGQSVMQFSLGPWETFWVLFYGFATYGNAGFMREQVCKYMCPYARFQSAMFDADTLIVTYDRERGEPRGGRSRSADPKTLGLGSCVDCSLCVQVCPTGIDIRQGLQYQCISCGACADVCNGIMDKMGYDRGLIRFTTQNGIENRWTQRQMWRRVLRPRVLVYSFLLGLLCVGLLGSLAQRDTFKVNVVRDRGVLARLAKGGMLENVYRLQIMNATEQTQHLRIGATGLQGLVVDMDGKTADGTVAVGPAEARWLAVRLRIPDGSAARGSHPVYFVVRADGSTEEISEKAVFLVPR